MIRSLVFVAALLVTCVTETQAQSLAISGSLSSEQVSFGLSEANGRPGVGLAVEWEVDRNFFVGVNAYQTTDAPAPDRPQNVTTYAGFHWDGSDTRQYDFTLLYRIYPRHSFVDWDFAELRFDVGFSEQFGIALSATNDFYAMGTNTVAASGEYVHDFSAKYYSRVEGGYVYFDSSVIDSYGYALLTAGMRGNRWSIEGGFRANNAEPFGAFRGSQIDDRFLLSASWLFY